MVSRSWLRHAIMTTTVRARPVFIAALQREIALLTKGEGWHTDNTHRAKNIHVYSHQDAIIACAGMGAHRASLAVEAALAAGPVSELISIGWAGACDDRLHVGDIIHPSIVIDAKTGERFFIAEPTTTEAPEILVTVATPAGAIEKQRLGISYYASAVDMEAAAVARIARARELPFHAIKAISDEADFELPDMQKFSTSQGQFREAAFGFHIALRPSLWLPVVTMAKSSKLAAERLGAEIESHIQQHRDRRP
jgi:adenosylhomocysteine nucleosidase